MWSWFGGAAAQKRKDAPKNAILLLREQLDMLQKREKHLEHLMEEQEAVARKNVSTNKNGAHCLGFLFLSRNTRLTFCHSCQSRSAKEKGPREEPRTDNRADRPARTADLLDRSGEYQPGDAERDEGRRRCHDTDPWLNDDRQGR
jgi:hypothetical protein